MNSPTSSTRRGRLVIVIIALLTFVPMLLAWYYANHPELINRHSNYGHLIQPPLPFGQDGVGILAASPAPLEDIRGHWVLIQVAVQGCEAVCVDTLHKTHQTRLMLNKEISRVRRLLIIPDHLSGWLPPAGEATDQSLVVVTATPARLQALRQVAGGSLADDGLILMDPLGNLILHYDSGFDPYRLIKDLQHLLKASRIG